MIREIEKICPEEGTPDDLPNNIYPPAYGMNTSTNYE
jgi:hypothetical protein